MITRTIFGRSAALCLSLGLSLIACRNESVSSGLSASTQEKRLEEIQSLAQRLLAEKVASIKGVALTDTNESYTGGREAQEVEVLKSLVKNLGNMMANSYLAGPGAGLNGMEYPRTKVRVLRDAHPKGLLCLPGRFEVKTNSIFAEGFLGTAESYPAIVRFSSSSPAVQADKLRDIRGFAVKVDTHQSPWNGPSGSHDFVNLSSKVFPSDTSAEFLDLVKATRIAQYGKDPRGFAACAKDTGLPNPLSLAAAAARFALATSSEPDTSLADKSFFAVTSYRYQKQGDSLYFKFRFEPKACEEEAVQAPIPLNPDGAENYLSQNIRDILASDSLCYDFKVIPLMAKADQKLIETHTKTWEELGVAGPAVSVASLRFTKDTKELDMTLCDEQTFSPGNMSQDFYALGSLNRARTIVYEKLSEFRLRLNAEIEKAGL